MHDKVQVSREVSLVYSTVARVYKHVRRASAFGQRHILPPSALLTVTSFEQPLGQVLWHDESLLVPACQPWSTEADNCCSLLVLAPEGGDLDMITMTGWGRAC